MCSSTQNVVHRNRGFLHFLLVIACYVLPLHFFTRLYLAIWGPAPLNEFADYDEYWDKRARLGMTDCRYRARYELITKHIPDGTSVLDIGCGDGAFLSYLKQQRPNTDVFGVDVSCKAVAMLRKRGLNGMVINPNRPLRSQIGRPFDYVVLMEVIEHVYDAESLCRQTLDFHPKRVFVTTPNMGFIINRLRLFIGGRMPVTVILFHMKEHIRFWTVKDFKQWAGVLGFEVKSISCRYNRKSAYIFNKTIVRWFPGLFGRQLVYELMPVSPLPSINRRGKEEIDDSGIQN